MKAEMKNNSLNQVMKGTNIFEEGDEANSIGLVIKGRVRVKSKGVNVVLGSGNFLGLCDLPGKVSSATYTAEINSAIYLFSVGNLNSAIRGLMKVNKDYGSLMVSTLAKHIRELSKIYDEFVTASNDLWQFIKDSYQTYQSIGKRTGAKAMMIKGIEELDMSDDDEIIDLDKAMYYRACAEVPMDIQKSYFGYNQTIGIYHITEEVALVNQLQAECRKNAEYLEYLAKNLVSDDKNLYKSVLAQVGTIKRMGEDTSEAMSLFDDIIDRINTLENLLIEHAGVQIDVDHGKMEDEYFELLNEGESSSKGVADIGDTFALVEEAYVDAQILDDSLVQILDYAELEPDKASVFTANINSFMEMNDKFATDDEARTIRRNIIKVYYELYKAVFLKDFNSSEPTPVVIDLFLRYGFLSEKLLSEQLLDELLSIKIYDFDGECSVYDMKEWLTLIMEGKKEPSKSEFDLDYDENLRDMRKTGQITAEQQQVLAKDLHAKFDYEIQNMFRTNHRLMTSQVTAFVPFLFTEGCSTSLSKAYLSKERINASVHRLLQIDFSAFHREILYAKEGSPFAKEYIQKQVFPDVILLPCFGSKGAMWQELSGRRRTSKGRFLMPSFLEGEIDKEMTVLFGRFRWELCRTIQGSSWNNIQIKSLTSEYSDFIQFYRKNRDLSDDKKEKLKMQIQKSRNNTREVFVIDYVNWIKSESKGGLVLSKPVREIMATYCPFNKETRDKLLEMPMYRDAMAKFIRERGKKTKEYELKLKVWTKDNMEIPDEVKQTMEFYSEK